MTLPSAAPRLEELIKAQAFGLGFDLLFLVVDELPTTVPIAAALAAVEVRDRRRARSISYLSFPSA